MTNYDIKEIQNLNIPKEKIFFNELMKNHTTFKIGGPAECFVKIENIGQLKEILKYTNVNNIHTNIKQATKSMFYDCPEDILKDYFNFDEAKKPKEKLVIATILNKIERNNFY